MTPYVAFLRGINLGKRRLKMERLRELFEQLDFDDVSTFIASGNVLFSSSARAPARLESRIESHLEAELGYAVDTFVRTRAEVLAAAAYQPFATGELEREENTIHVGFLKEELSPELARGLQACRTDVDAFKVNRREFFWLCRIPTHESKVWSSPAMRALKLPTATLRNRTMLAKLVATF